jgi:hypothetical protein
MHIQVSRDLQKISWHRDLLQSKASHAAGNGVAKYLTFHARLPISARLIAVARKYRIVGEDWGLILKGRVA